MADPLHDIQQTISAFHGHRLSAIPKLNPDLVATLARYAYHDVEQVIAAAQTGPGKAALHTALGVDIDALLRTLTEFAPAAGLRVAAAGPPRIRHTGAYKPHGAVHDHQRRKIAEHAAAAPPPAALPSSVLYATLLPTPRNQGGRGTCVAHALTAVTEWYWRPTRGRIDLSEQFLYEEAKVVDQRPDLCGTYIVSASSALSKLGECEETVWPYNPNDPCNGNGVEPANAKGEAQKYLYTPLQLNPTDVSALKAALAGGSLVAFTVPIYNTWYQSPESERTGRLTLPIGGESDLGGHAMCLIGYFDDPTWPGGGYFVLRNSWDTTWGRDCPFGPGNGTIPYQYLADHGWEAATSPIPPGLQREATPAPVASGAAAAPPPAAAEAGRERVSIEVLEGRVLIRTADRDIVVR